MGGDVTCTSEAGVGSVFTITIPFKKEASSFDAQFSLVEDLEPENDHCCNTDCCSTENLRILVAEDNPVNQEVARRFLKRLKCESVFAANGAEAIQILRKQDFDMVFMDCQMPEVDGFQATRMIRKGSCGEQKKNIYISAMTANAMTGDKERCLDAGMDAYVSKPMRVADLKEAISSCRREQDRQAV